MRPTMALDHTPEVRPSLHTLEQRGDFIRRHIGPDPRQIGDMLGTLGLATLETLIDQAVPAAIRVTEPLALAEAMSERETVSYLRRMRDRNRVFISMLGMGYYGTVVPAVIRRNVLEN
ncbi:MAG: glycine dehydrogenase (aminomethyl-transferring), partial [Gammaproteobacteria bacterium]